MLTGLGARDASGSFPAETLRRAAGRGARADRGRVRRDRAARRRRGRARRDRRGALLGAYSFTRYRAPSGAAKAAGPVATIEVLTSLARGAKAKAAAERAATVAAAVHATRDLVNTAPNDLYPRRSPTSPRPPPRARASR
ncbi:hypothetical protein NKG05_26275 [Oerskovia sp. M15]